MTFIDLTRPIRSYVLRAGRMTPAQQQALSQNWPVYGLDMPLSPQMVDWQQVFGRTSRRILEIGFGMGDSLIAQAKAHPEIDFIGIEVHPPGIGKVMANAKIYQLTNLKIFAFDAVQVLDWCIPDESIDKVLLLFPDPWPKKKHHKRRILQPSFATKIAQKLKKGGQFHLATDWQDYADQMLAVLDALPDFENFFGKGHFAPSTFERILTKFEKRGQKLGHQIWDLVYTRL
ncbi:MAG: tRNA (guanosine(46)-N7)-methyltransferase TrmB [Gammaproteobacteria bacterium]|jgi:tRNA (guanine-N7-)-methyltransferase|nr:tRNA (guanosine(46)-N7)-methyltransferase TrmB [Gammaproteobacteria bacterium]